MKEKSGSIEPIRMALLMKAAGNITEIMAKANVDITYEECRVILDMVSNAIWKAEHYGEGK